MEVRGAGPWTVEDLPEEPTAQLELLDGALLVRPVPGVRHQRVVGQLLHVLGEPVAHRVLPGVNLLRRGDTDRLLVPDVVVVDAVVVGRDELWVDPSDVLLVVEVESVSTRIVDRVLKRELYAQWRVPGYWIVDPDAETVTRLVLTAERTYAEGAGPVPWLADVDSERLWTS
ncbi:Uma2 family endonuclease [Kineococcus sp. SYSU DK004]|uniref:Uma2 family endonuclease n=1 Tax=Kineococcus sp. SYSU DK004 TaxID=3383125 RepID=UPI003D7EE955